MLHSVELAMLFTYIYILVRLCIRGYEGYLSSCRKFMATTKDQDKLRM